MPTSKEKKNKDGGTNVKCAVCNKIDVEIECEICLGWFHSNCAKISQLKLSAISNHDMHWYCSNCDVGAVTLHEKILELISENTKLQKKVATLTTDVKKVQAHTTTILNECEQKVDDKLIEERNTLKEDLKREIKEDLKKELKTEIQHEIAAEPNNTGDDADEDTTPWRTALGRHRGPTVPTPNLRNIIQEEMMERKNIELLKKNLVISGVKESDSDNEDIEKVINIIKDNLDIDAEIEKVERCGRFKPADEDKPRLLKLSIRTQENRKKILQNATKLRNAEEEYIKTTIYISPDLTKKQQFESKNLRAELRAKRIEIPEKRFKIQRGRIVEIPPAPIPAAPMQPAIDAE